MIIDLILDRRDGFSYDAREFYFDVRDYENSGMAPTTGKDCISLAMDEGTDQDVKRALCAYIRNGGYNPAICDYINSVNWI
jgi:hypothetical protein